MNGRKLHLVPVGEKHLRLSGVPALLARFLFELPEILRRRDEAHGRLFQDLVPHEPDTNAEWHRLMDADLQHLFASAEETVLRDLTQFDAEKGEVVFPVAHVRAWMGALNQARLILGELHHVNEHDMDADNLDMTDPRQRALLQIHLLGWLLHLFIDHENPDRL